MSARMRKILNHSISFFHSLKWVKPSLLITAFSLVIFSLTGCHGQNIGVLNPKGVIAFEERKLFFDTLALMLIVVLPVIIMSFAFVYHYQVSHKIKDYKPNWAHSYFLESLWWGIPCVIIFVLAILTWKKTYELDPARPITTAHAYTLPIQAIALPWKWLFIYPQQNIATVNYLVLPVGEQVEFSLTTDNAPMSSFFIPQLGSQIYAMAGMRTRLHLLANEVGTYDGMNTLFNGDGFADMHFVVHVVDEKKLQQWFAEMKKSSPPLNEAAYIALLKPSAGNKPQYYSGVSAHLFENVISLYMNTYGTVHPREHQANYSNPSKPQEE